MVVQKRPQPKGCSQVAWEGTIDEEAQNGTPQQSVMAARFGDDAKSEEESDLESVGDVPDETKEVDWDSAPGISGAIATHVKDHYYTMFNVFMIVVHVFAAVVFFAPPDGRCVEKQGMGQMQVCTQSEHDWELSFLEASKRKDAIGYARVEGSEAFTNLSSIYLGTNANREDPRSEASDIMNLRLLFWHEDEEANVNNSIFTPKKVADMCTIESFLTAHPFYPSFCVLNSNGTCAPQRFSIAAQFYDADQLDPASGGCQELDAEVIANRSAAIAADFSVEFSFFASIDAVDGGFTNQTRSLLQLGAPLAGYADEDDEAAEQRDLYLKLFRDTKCGNFGDADKCAEDVTCAAVKGYCTSAGIEEGTTVEGVETLLFNRYQLSGVPKEGPYEGAFVSPYDRADPVEEYSFEADMSVRFWSVPLQQEEFARVVNGDLNFALLSVVLVGCYIWFHTQSLMISLLSMFQIVISLPVGFFFYYNVFQIRYYASVNILAIYLALGIGADSVFVFSDSWNQSRANPAIQTVVGRLTYAIHRTVTSCFNTTLTTVMSFVATSFTPVVPIYCFAAFASCVLAVNYVFVCLFTPVVVMLHHLVFSDIGGVGVCCDKRAGQVTPQCAPKEAYVKADLLEIREKDVYYAKYSPFTSQYWFPTPNQDEMRAEEEAKDELGKLSRSERFFHNQFFGLLNFSVFGIKIGAWTCIVLTVGYAAFMATQAFRLTPPTSQEEWFPSRHMFNGALNDRLFDNWKGSSDNGYMNMAFVFGVETVDRSSHNRLFPNYKRGEVVFDDDFDLSSEAAQLFFLQVCTELESVACPAAACPPSQDLVLRGGEVNCVMRDLLAYYQSLHVNYTNATVIPSAEFDQVAIDFFTDVKNGSVSVAELELRQQQYQSVIGLDEDEGFTVQWAAITFRSSVTIPMSNSESRELFKLYDGLEKDFVADAPAGMDSLFQTDTQSSGVGWTWRDVEDALVANLLRGFVICFPVAFVVLVLATGNVLIALYATASIAFIVAGVLGAAKLYHGWDLGIAESIAGVIVIGFSVDYTVHLGHMYAEGEGTREEKTQHALTYMGTTVVGGGLTTLIAGLVLFLCTLTFFTKMALLLVWTVALSIIYALCFFMPMCILFGPQGNFAKVPTMFQFFTVISGFCVWAFRGVVDFSTQTFTSARESLPKPKQSKRSMA